MEAIETFALVSLASPRTLPLLSLVGLAISAAVLPTVPPIALSAWRETNTAGVSPLSVISLGIGLGQLTFSLPIHSDRIRPILQMRRRP